MGGVNELKPNKETKCLGPKMNPNGFEAHLVFILNQNYHLWLIVVIIQVL